MEFDDYLKLVGSISRIDAVYHFGLSFDELDKRVRRGELLLLADEWTAYADRFRLAHPEDVHPIDLRGRTLVYHDSLYTVALSIYRPGLWELRRESKYNRFKLVTTRTLLELLGL